MREGGVVFSVYGGEGGWQKFRCLQSGMCVLIGYFRRQM